MTTVAANSKPEPEIEFWFEFGSNYSYLSVMRIEDEARRHGVRISWKPFLLGPIFRALGMENSPFVLQKQKGAYVWQDMVRQCRKYGLRWVQPSTFPRLGVMPLRIALLGAEKPWIAAFCRRVMELNFALDQDINQPDSMVPILIGAEFARGGDPRSSPGRANEAALAGADGRGARARNIWRPDLLRRNGDVLG